MKRWKSWGGSTPGPAHQKKALPNQDAWAVEHLPWGDVLVVSDGVGSCARSEVGARAACTAVKEAAAFCFRHQTWDLSHLAELIQALWRMLVFPFAPEDCAATCLFVIREEGGQAVLGMLGDGLLAALTPDGGVELMIDEKVDSFSNITATLGSAAAPVEWKLRSDAESAWCGFLLCTDGIADDLSPESREIFVTDAMAHYRACPAEEIEVDLQRWLENWPVPGHTDDKTIACLYRREEEHD